ncbi:MAG: hypothetical protein IJC48_10190 [Clostridia bacterium]|nr:hypothetical protein [Clostridia bacterium]MBQ4158268.1 hypothetical protein [Clostridia bacterium]
MGQNSFAEHALQLVLGWLQSLMSGVWSLFSGGGGGSMLRWLSDNWLSLLIVFLAAGIVIDTVVYLFRWRPFWWWFRKKRMVVDDAIFDDKPIEDVFDLKPSRRAPHSNKKRPSTRIPERIKKTAASDDGDLFMDDDLMNVKRAKKPKTASLFEVEESENDVPRRKRGAGN